MDRVRPRHERRVQERRARARSARCRGRRRATKIGDATAISSALTPRRPRFVGTLPVVRDAGLARRSRPRSRARARRPCTRCSRSAWTLREYIWLACTGIVAGRFGRPTIVTPSRSTISPGAVSSQLPPVSAARSTITEPGRIAAHRVRGDEHGRAAGRGSAAVVMTTSDSATCVAISSCSRSVLLLGELGRVAARRPRRPRRRARGTSRRGSRPAPSRPGACRRPRRPRRGAAPSRSPAGPATPAPRTSTFAGGIVPAAVVSIGKNFASVLGGEEHRLVAGDGRLRRERVHRLGARDARDRVHREGGHAARGERARRARCRRAAAGARRATWPSRSGATSSGDGFCTLQTSVGLGVERGGVETTARRPPRRRRRGTTPLARRPPRRAPRRRRRRAATRCPARARPGAPRARSPSRRRPSCSRRESKLRPCTDGSTRRASKLAAAVGEDPSALRPAHGGRSTSCSSSRGWRRTRAASGRTRRSSATSSGSRTAGTAASLDDLVDGGRRSAVGRWPRSTAGRRSSPAPRAGSAARPRSRWPARVRGSRSARGGSSRLEQDARRASRRRAISIAPLDVTDDASCEAFVAQAVEALGRIDILVNNAGLALGRGRSRRAPTTTTGSWSRRTSSGSCA